MIDTCVKMNDYPFKQHFDAFQALIGTFIANDIAHYLIGGQARDLLMSQKDIKPISVTPDIDFAIMVQDFGQFAVLQAELIKAGFKETKLQYRMLWPKTQMTIDLLPFGGISEEDIVHFPPPAFDLSVLGFKELMDTLEHYHIDEARTLSIPVAPLHGIFLLKVISWDDRPESRGKDLADLSQILTHYWDFFQEEIYDYHLDILDLGIENMEGFGARLLGRHLAHPLSKSKVLHTRFIKVLQKQANLIDPPGPMLLKFSRENWDGERNIAYSKELLDQVLLGIDDRSVL